MPIQFDIVHVYYVYEINEVLLQLPCSYKTVIKLAQVKHFGKPYIWQARVKAELVIDKLMINLYYLKYIYKV